MSPRSRARTVIRGVIILVVLAAIVVVFDLGMFTNLLTSFKSDRDISSVPPKWIFQPVLTHYHNVLKGAGYAFDRYLTNSVIVGLGSMK